MFRNYGILVRSTQLRKSQETHFQELWDSCAQEKNVGNIKICTFRKYGIPVRRTKRQKSQKMDFQDFWDSCALNKTSYISNNALSEILGLLCAEQNVGNLKNYTFRNSGTPVRRTRRRKYKKMNFHELWDSCAQNHASEISKNLPFRNSGTLARRTKRQKSQKMQFQDLWDSWIQDPGSWITGPGSRILDPGSWILDHGSWIQDHGCRILDPGSVIQDPGSWIQGF